MQVCTLFYRGREFVLRKRKQAGEKKKKEKVVFHIDVSRKLVHLLNVTKISSNEIQIELTVRGPTLVFSGVSRIVIAA